ncbi:MAG: hypothetical protein ACI80S_000377 [Pseudohongiellaceae bacterium]|jgi:uncharacterized protein YdiU (UPF0061 family)
MKNNMLIEGLELTQCFHQLQAELSTPVIPQGIADAQLLQKNNQVAQLLDVDIDVINSPAFLDVFSGNAVLTNSSPIACAYAGHQLGNFNPFLGDGRSVLLGEIKSSTGYWEVGLKGSGKTAYSFSADGRASIDECLHEDLISERLAQLDIPTSRSLCVIKGSEKVYRSGFKTAAILARIAPSFVRFGSFEYCFFKKDTQALKALADFVIDRHFADCLSTKDDNNYAKFFHHVVEKTAVLIASWQNAGFVHGMMNTDNQSIVGITLDLGESVFIDPQDDRFVASTSDEHGRYAFGQQPIIGLWNCNVLARALSPLISSNDLKLGLSVYERTYLDRLQS